MNKKVALILKLLVIIWVLVFSSGCSMQQDQKEIVKLSDDKLMVYTTLYILEEFSKKIGGELVNVVNLVPSGVNPHHYEPSAKDVALLAEGDIFIYNGGGLELWVNKVIKNLEEYNVEIINASQDIELINGQHEHEGHGNEKDPHVWLNPLLALKEAETIKDAFIRLDPLNAKMYNLNYEKLKEEIILLDTKMNESLIDIDRKDFFVSHAAFGYLAERYGLNQHSINGLSPEDEPSPAELSKIIKTLKDLNIKYILVDSTEGGKISKVIADELGIKIEYIYTISSLSNEELDKGMNYVKMMEKNLDILIKALEK